MTEPSFGLSPQEPFYGQVNARFWLSAWKKAANFVVLLRELFERSRMSAVAANGRKWSYRVICSRGFRIHRVVLSRAHFDDAGQAPFARRRLGIAPFRAKAGNLPGAERAHGIPRKVRRGRRRT